MRVAAAIALKPAMRNKLSRYSKAFNVSPKLKVRSSIILLADEGMTNKQIAAELGIDEPQVGRWRNRFAKQGLPGIEKDKSRPGRIKPLAKSKESEIIRKTIETKPKGATHWSRSLMAAETGVSESTVGRVWARAGLKPHRIRTFKLSNDKRFEEKLEDIVGLYPDLFMKRYCDLLQARRGGVGLVLPGIEHCPMHSAWQNRARLATTGFRGVSLRLS